MNDPTSLKNAENPESNEWSPEDIAAFNKAEDERDADQENFGKLIRENKFGRPSEAKKPDDSDDSEDSDDSDDSSDDK